MDLKLRWLRRQCCGRVIASGLSIVFYPPYSIQQHAAYYLLYCQKHKASVKRCLGESRGHTDHDDRRGGNSRNVRSKVAGIHVWNRIRCRRLMTFYSDE